MKRALLAPLAILITGCGAGDVASGEYAREILADLSPVERHALEDKQVTFGEYESSIQRHRECLTAIGYEVDPAEFQTNGLLGFFYGTEGIGEEQMAETDTAADACFQEVDAIEAVYSLGAVPSEAERRAGDAEFRACALDLGASSANSGSVNDVIAELYDLGFSDQIDPDVGEACLEKYVAVSLIPIPGLAEALAELQF